MLRELEGRGYVDAATSADAGWQPTWPADGQVRVGGVAVPPLLALDHVLINEVLHVVSTEAVAIEGTDHRALVAELVAVSDLLAGCPCGSGRPYAACCGPFHDGAPAPTAEALMRSRYSAYVLGRIDHLFRTWHPRTRPDDLTSAAGEWRGLEVLRTEGGTVDDEAGVVEFEARHRGPHGLDTLHETSRFERRGGRWVYVDGMVD